MTDPAPRMRLRNLVKTGEQWTPKQLDAFIIVLRKVVDEVQSTQDAASVSASVLAWNTECVTLQIGGCLVSSAALVATRQRGYRVEEERTADGTQRWHVFYRAQPPPHVTARPLSEGGFLERRRVATLTVTVTAAAGLLALAGLWRMVGGAAASPETRRV